MLSPKVRLEKGHIKAYLKQLLEGLHYLHTRLGVTHGDLTLSNVGVRATEPELDVVLLDFGSARQLGQVLLLEKWEQGCQRMAPPLTH